MSDRERILDLLGAEGKPTGTVAEESGLETAVAAQLLQELKREGLAHSGRGGWRKTGAEDEPPESAEAPAPARKPRRKKKAKGRKPRLATVEQLASARKPPARRTAPPPRIAEPSDDPGVAFGIDETGALLATDGQQIKRFTPDQTRRLAAFLDRMRPVLPEAA